MDLKANLFQIVFVCLWTTYCCSKNVRMIKVKDDHATMVTLGVSLLARSTLACVAKCGQRNNSCYSISYEPKTLNCTLGSWVIVSNTTLRQPNVDIYARGAICNLTSGWIYHSYNNVTSCFWLSNCKANYTDSQAYCLGVNANLYTLKVAEKIYFLNKTFSSLSYDFWVGLNDMKTENVFRWVDDDTIADNATRTMVFCPGQPNQFVNVSNGLDQDCVAYSNNYYPLHDTFCYYLQNFLCEMKTIFFL